VKTISDNDSTSRKQLLEKIYDKIKDIAPEKADDYQQIAEKDHYMLPGDAIALPVEIDEIAECYGLDFNEENAREIAERTVLVYFMNEGVLRDYLLGQKVEEEPSTFIEHLQINASEELQRTICKLYEEVHPHEWKDIERDVKEGLEIPEDSNFPAEEVAQQWDIEPFWSNRILKTASGTSTHTGERTSSNALQRNIITVRRRSATKTSANVSKNSGSNQTIEARRSSRLLLLTTS